MSEQIEVFTPCTEEEFDALWQLNHEIFASELKMRATSDNGRIVDKFHHKNIYRALRVCDSGKLAGLISAHWQAPYSAAAHFGDEVCAPPREGKLGEIRLYALLAQYRSTTLAAQLAVPLLLELDKNGVSEVIISGISTRKRFYEHLGFKAAGEPVAEGDTQLYPMRGNLKEILNNCRRALERFAAEK